VESVNQRCDGSLFPVRISATAEEGSGLSRIIFVIEDITAEKERRTEEEAIAEERRRIAREIHDGLAQDLASLRFRARLWHQLVDEDPARMHVELDGLRELLSREIREVRRSIFALRAVALDELGFYPALEQFAQGFGEQNQLHVELRISGPQHRLPPSLEPVLFRIVQEALNNVGKHARAETAWVTLDLRGEASLTLTVRDDGVGLDPSVLDGAVRLGHLGMKQMRERVEALDGDFGIESQASVGTTIRVVLPLPD
jgi:signal transduction histidine kinase